MSRKCVNRALLGAGVMLVAWGFPPTAAQQPTVDQNFAVIRALDKITARAEALNVEVGQEATFGTLSLLLRACRSTAPERTPEDVMFIEVRDRPPGSEAVGLIYSGWMFASAPSVAALDHPIYDIWLEDCLAERRVEQPSAPESGYRLPDTPPPPPPLPDWRR